MDNQLIKTYKVRVIREEGLDPLTNQHYAHAAENFSIDADSAQSAHRLAQSLTTIKFRGQVMRVFVDDLEHIDERL